jgi:hypothetical protein
MVNPYRATCHGQPLLSDLSWSTLTERPVMVNPYRATCHGQPLQSDLSWSTLTSDLSACKAKALSRTLHPNYVQHTTTTAVFLLAEVTNCQVQTSEQSEQSR